MTASNAWYDDHVETGFYPPATYLLISISPTGGDGPNANVFKDRLDRDSSRRYKAVGMERHLLEPGEKPNGRYTRTRSALLIGRVFRAE